MRFLLFFSLLSFFFLCLLSHGEVLHEGENAKYLESTYSDVLVHIKQYSTRTKHLRQFTTVFNSVNDNIPAPFSSIKTMNRKYCSVVIAGVKNTLPLFLSLRDKKAVAFLRGLSSGVPIKIYACLEYKKKSKKKHYFLCVRKIESLQVKIKTAPESGGVFDKKNFMRIKPRRIDIQSKLFDGRKVVFKAKFKNISKNIPRVLLKGGMNTDRIFLLLVDGLLTPIVVDKSNSQCVEAIIDADVNDDITVYATLRKFSYTEEKRTIKTYYLVPLWISNETKVSALPDE